MAAEGSYDINRVEFCTAGAALFEFPTMFQLRNYAESTELNLILKTLSSQSNGEAKTAQFVVVDANGTEREVTRSLICYTYAPLNVHLKLLLDSPLSDDSGWVDVNSVRVYSTKPTAMFMHSVTLRIRSNAKSRQLQFANKRLSLQRISYQH